MLPGKLNERGCSGRLPFVKRKRLYAGRGLNPNVLSIALSFTLPIAFALSIAISVTLAGRFSEPHTGLLRRG